MLVRLTEDFWIYSRELKRIGNIYEKIISVDNLYLAEQKARRGKAHKNYIKVFDKNKNKNIISLHNSLKNHEFYTSKYDVFEIFEPKLRLIYRLPYYPDRIVHHAIMNILEPIWIKVFPYNTYSCIKNRGIHACMKLVLRIIRKYHNKELYCLKIDIKLFYPTINNEILKTIVRKTIKDKEVLWLLDGIIDSARGLPIGNYLSLYLANLYLSYFIHWVNNVLKLDCVCYADDIVFFSNNKNELHDKFVMINDYLKNKLKLLIKNNYQIFPIANNRYSRGRALDYIGFQFYRNLILLRKRVKRHFCVRIHNILYRKYSYKEFKIKIAPWLGWIKYSNSIHLLNKLVKNKIYYDLLLRETFNIRTYR